jgi:hypothetical protein
LLTHDPPTSTKTDYYASDQILEYLLDPRRKPAFQRSTRLNIALCFKVPTSLNPCDRSKISSNWLYLTDELVSIFQEHVDKYELNVEFVLDGAATGIRIGET